MSEGSIHGRPIPQGAYLTAKRHKDLIFTSGMTPRREGVLVEKGAVRIGVPLDTYEDAVILATSNALSAGRAVLEDGETIGSVLNMTVYIAAQDGFAEHARIADFASFFLMAELGPSGMGSRAAIGVATLPGHAPVEIQLVLTVAAGSRNTAV